jgi:hypothetical protein
MNLLQRIKALFSCTTPTSSGLILGFKSLYCPKSSNEYEKIALSDRVEEWKQELEYEPAKLMQEMDNIDKQYANDVAELKRSYLTKRLKAQAESDIKISKLKFDIESGELKIEIL